ncbi:hypothetical protein GGI12_002610 [Dipsacomyces acuminosporus]|nr:hypothetical protein GGI12_002610 [Dipsacomyces acuminosporus]
MSAFSLTPQEKDRMLTASMIGYTLDPISHKDLALIIAISSVYAFNLLAVVFLLWNRNYPPLKSKGPVLMSFALLSCICWFIGDLQINGHVHLSGTILTNCKGVGVWMRVLLGVCTVSSLIALRSYGLYRVFRQNLPYNGLGFYLPFVVYSACTIVCGIVTQVLKPSATVEYIEPLDVCYCPKPFRAALYVYIWATWLLIAIINWKIRSIKSSFNESREMAFSCFVVFAILTFNTALQFSKPAYIFNQTQRLLTTGLDHVATNLVWWSIMGVPLFNCLLNRSGYLQYWKEKLRKDGLQHEYDIDSSSGHSGTMTPFNDQRHRNTTLYNDMNGSAFIYPNAQLPDEKLAGSDFKAKITAATTMTTATATKVQQPPRVVTTRGSGGNNMYLGENKTDVSLAQTVKTKRFTADPFDIPPVSPTTAVCSPRAIDPFEPFPGCYRPTSYDLETYSQIDIPATDSYTSQNDYLEPGSQDSFEWPPQGANTTADAVADEYDRNQRRII